MTISDQTPLRLLPMSDHVRGKRSAVTCQLKCANACLGPECNTSDNAALPRHRVGARSPAVPLLGLGARRRASASWSAMPPAAARTGAAYRRAAGHGRSRVRSDRPRQPPRRRRSRCRPATRGSRSSVGRPAVLVDAGARLRAPDPRGAGRPVRLQQRLPRHHRRPERQDRRAREQPRVREPEHHVPAPTSDPAERRRRGDIYKAAQGMSVVELQRRKVGEPWSYVVDGRRNRRITVETVFELTGPAAGSDLVKTAADPEGRWVQGHAGQLLRRHHAVGHGAVGRGELQRLLRLGRRHGRAEALQRHGDDLDGDRLGGLRPPLRRARPRLRERAEPVRLHRRDRPERPDRRRR